MCLFIPHVVIDISTKNYQHLKRSRLCHVRNVEARSASMAGHAATIQEVEKDRAIPKFNASITLLSKLYSESF